LTVFIVAPLCVNAQWLNHRDPRAPRTSDGKPRLSAPAPHRSGKPDLSGIWEAESTPRKELAALNPVGLLPGGENGLGEDDPQKYFLNFFSDYKFGEEPFQPAARAPFLQMLQGGNKPPTLCPPPSLPIADLIPAPYKIVQTPSLILILYEGDTSFFRQIFMDGRSFPADPQPSWLGYSIGRWEGDWLVVETVGFNGKGPLDAMGHPHSDAMRLKERFHRRDFGHMETEITVDDPKTYSKPVTIKVNQRLLPDTDLIESFCTEAESDLTHLPGK
jgi:hypothetical protein